MARLTKAVMFGRIRASFEDSGWNVELLSEAGVHPIEFRLQRGRDRFDIRAYVWNLTHGGKTRSKDELRIQATGITLFERMIGAQTLILGWSEEFETFAGFDIDRHSNPLGSSPSLQISRSTLESAQQRGIAARTKSNNEIVVAVRPDLLGAYVENRARLHDPAEAQLAVDALREAFDDQSDARLSELSGYVDLAESGATPILGTREELAERRAILERLAALEKEISEIRQQPGMIGHNRPPPDEGTEEANVAEVADAAREMGQELERSEPRPAEVARRATVMERVAAAWRALRKEAVKTVGQLKDELKERAVGAAATTIVGGGTIYHKELGEIVDAVLAWLRLIFS